MLLLRLLALAAVAGVCAGGCTDGGNGGCSRPIHPKWDTWSMASSTYTYCFNGCAVDWLYNQSYPYAGVVGVDHYWTHQGMPCIDGKPQEFAAQDALASKWKARFPGLRFLSYRILSAVNYDMVVQEKIQSDPFSVVRWRHAPGDASVPGNGSVCWNGKSGCFNDPKRINNPANKCDFHISAAAYNWSNPDLKDWFVESIIAPSLKVADGIWLDGIGPDNGAYMCSGVCCGYGSHNSPLVQDEIDSHCDAQAEATTAAQSYLIANGGWEAMRCFDYLEAGAHGVLPSAADSPQVCAQRLQERAAWAANHSNYNFVVAYGDRTGGMKGYSDDTVHGTVAAFLLMRGQHWLFSIGPNGGGGGESYPPYENKPGYLLPATAEVLTSDFGKPLNAMSAVAGKANVFQREFEKATVTLDCNDFSGTFLLKHI